MGRFVGLMGDVMAHGTLINGAAHGITGGKCFISGTEYSIKNGRTLIDGTGYNIEFSPPTFMVTNVGGEGKIGTTYYCYYEVDGHEYISGVQEFVEGTKIKFFVDDRFSDVSGVYLNGEQITGRRFPESEYEYTLNRNIQVDLYVHIYNRIFQALIYEE